MPKLKVQYSGHLMQRANSLEKTLMLGKTEGKGVERAAEDERLDSITDSMDRNSGTLWEEQCGLACCNHGFKKSWTRLATEQYIR